MVNTSTAVPATTLGYVKAHTRIESDLDDLLLEAYILSATQLCEHVIHQPIIARDNSGWDESFVKPREDGLPAADVCAVPPAIQNWIAGVVAYWYRNREQSSDLTLRPTPNYDSLLDFWRIYEP